MAALHHCQTYPYPKFYKLYVPENSSERLHVPPSFVSYLSGKGKALPDRILLRSSRHRSMIWDVEVNKEDFGGVFFQRGWVSFVTDLSLELGDLVTFRFDGDRTFCVTVFGTSWTEKEDDFGTDDDDNDNDNVCVSDDDDVDVNDDEIDAKRLLGSQKNPYFVTNKVKSGRALRIPSEVLKGLKRRGYKLDGKVVIVRDSDGKEWTRNAKEWIDGSVHIRGGWRAFNKTNRLDEQDKCVWELVLEKGEKTVHVIQFHILRAS